MSPRPYCLAVGPLSLPITTPADGAQSPLVPVGAEEPVNAEELEDAEALASSLMGKLGKKGTKKKVKASAKKVKASAKKAKASAKKAKAPAKKVKASAKKAKASGTVKASAQSTLAYPGSPTAKAEPMSYKGCRIYTDLNVKKWRVKGVGCRKDKTFSWKVRLRDSLMGCSITCEGGVGSAGLHHRISLSKQLYKQICIYI